MSFKEIKPEELNFNPFTRIGSDWMLLTAGTEDKFNTMTASWGGAGVFWGKPAVTCYIRPQRYTKEFIDKEELFSVSFLKTDTAMLSNSAAPYLAVTTTKSRKPA